MILLHLNVIDKEESELYQKPLQLLNIKFHMWSTSNQIVNGIAMGEGQALITNGY